MCSVGSMEGFPQFSLLPGWTLLALAELSVLDVLHRCPSKFSFKKAPTHQEVFIISVKTAQEVTISKNFV